MHNFSIGLENWQAVEVQLVLPCCMPPELGGGVGLEATGMTDLLPAALKRGTFFTREALQKFTRVQGCTPTQGSGKNHAVVKVDLALALVKHLFPDAPDAEATRMVNACMGRRKEISPELLQILANLDPENESDGLYKKMRQEATEQLARSHAAWLNLKCFQFVFFSGGFNLGFTAAHSGPGHCCEVHV